MPLKNPDTKAGLQKAIDALLKEMSSIDADSDEYAKMADQLVKLYNLKEVDSKRKISPDALVSAAVTFIVAVWITRYERDNVFTSKTLDFIRTLRP